MQSTHRSEQLIEHRRSPKFPPGVKITYETCKVLSKNGEENNGEFTVRKTAESTLSDYILIGQADGGKSHKDLKVTSDDPTRASPNCILSGYLPKPWPEDRTKHKPIIKEGVDMMAFAGLAYSQLYNGSYESAKKNMETYSVMVAEKRRAGEKNDTAVISTLLELESAAYLGRHRAGILENLDEIVKEFRQNPVTKPVSLLLRLAVGMAENTRHYGAILAFRAASFAYHPPLLGDRGSRFRFMYSMVLEMSVRALNVFNQNWNGNKLVIRCMHDVVQKMTAMAKCFSKEDRKKIALDKEVIMIAECRNAIAFCCNAIGMFGTADKIASEGLRKIESFRDRLLRRYKIYPDLLLNKGNSLLGLKQLRQAKYFFETANVNYGLCKDLIGAALEERRKRARINSNAVDKFNTVLSRISVGLEP